MIVGSERIVDFTAPSDALHRLSTPARLVVIIVVFYLGEILGYRVGKVLFILLRPNSGIRAIASGFRPLIAHMRYAGGSRLDLFAVYVVGL